MAEKKATKPKVERFKTITGTVAAFISAGFEEIQGVGEEFREIVDNTPESLQGTDLYSTRENTADTIEGLTEPSVDSDILGGLDCSTQIDMGKTYRGRQSQSRACRANNGAAQLRAAADAVNAWLGEHDEAPDASSDSANPDELEELAEKCGDDDEREALLARAKFLRYFVGDNSLDDYNEAREQAESLAQECEEVADEVENLEYPGMFG